MATILSANRSKTSRIYSSVWTREENSFQNGLQVFRRNLVRGTILCRAKRGWCSNKHKIWRPRSARMPSVTRFVCGLCAVRSACLLGCLWGPVHVQPRAAPLVAQGQVFTMPCRTKGKKLSFTMTSLVVPSPSQRRCQYDGWYVSKIAFARGVNDWVHGQTRSKQSVRSTEIGLPADYSLAPQCWLF